MVDSGGKVNFDVVAERVFTETVTRAREAGRGRIGAFEIRAAFLNISAKLLAKIRVRTGVLHTRVGALGRSTSPAAASPRHHGLAARQPTSRTRRAAARPKPVDAAGTATSSSS